MRYTYTDTWKRTSFGVVRVYRCRQLDISWKCTANHVFSRIDTHSLYWISRADFASAIIVIPSVGFQLLEAIDLSYTHPSSNMASAQLVPPSEDFAQQLFTFKSTKIFSAIQTLQTNLAEKGRQIKQAESHSILKTPLGYSRTISGFGEHAFAFEHTAHQYHLMLQEVIQIAREYRYIPEAPAPFLGLFHKGEFLAVH